jgi:hypothetical protein
MWTRSGVCPTNRAVERFWHAGLRSDGRMCLVAASHEEAYFVWDVAAQRIVWCDGGDLFAGLGLDGEVARSSAPDLAEWIGRDGCVELADGAARGRYRMFGLHHRHGLGAHADLGVLTVDEAARELVIDEPAGLRIRLPYEAASGDWAFASFADDAPRAAVVEPYYVTFYARVK